jgi:hypothetical protein
MRKFIFVLLSLSAVFFTAAFAAGDLCELSMPEGTNLLANPTMQPDVSDRIWRVPSAIKWSFADIDGRKTARFTTDKPGYHYGPNILLPGRLPGHKYLLSMIIKADIKDNQGKCVIFNIDGKKTYNGGGFHISKWRERTDISFNWTFFTRFFVTPKEFSEENLSLYAFLLYGICDIHVAEIGLYDMGPSNEEPTLYFPREKPPANKAAEEVIAVESAPSRTDYSDCKPENVRIHLAEKVLPPTAGNTVSFENGKITMNYSFGSDQHDALFFDLVKEADGFERLSLDITGDGSGHRLALVLTDAGDENHLVFLTPIRHQGKQHFDFNLIKLMPALKPYEISASKWGGDRNMKVDLPVKKLTFVLDDVPDASKGQGSIILENIVLGVWK